MAASEVASPALRSILSRPGVSPALVALEDALEASARKLAPRLAARYRRPALDPADLATQVRDGRVLADLHDPLPPLDLLAEAADHLLAALTRHLPESAAWRAWLPDADTAAAAADLPTWFTAAWRNNVSVLGELAETHRLERESLHWVGRRLCRPFFQTFMEPLRGHAALARDWPLAAGCPGCGGPPRMGRYRGEEGTRTLWCELCDLEWGFPRITCPFCLNRDQKQLGFLSVDGLTGYRIDVCEICHGYLRARDEREPSAEPAADLRIEDVGTVHLSLVAERDGYRSGRVAPALRGGA